MSELVSATIKVCGEVKLVGFRRFVWSIAKRTGLNGFVANTKDNCVVIYVEGRKDAIDNLLKNIETSIYTIESIDVKLSNYTGKYNDFIVLQRIGDIG